MRWLSSLFEKHKFARRATLVWACWLITVVVLRVTEKEVIIGLSASGVTVVTGVIGILATVIGFYQWHRSRDDDR